MLVHQAALGLRLLGLVLPSLHLDWNVAAQEQVRAGVSHVPAVAGSNTLSFSEIVSPSAQGHLTFVRGGQDLLLRYQPRFLDTLQVVDGTAFWTGWSQMHRVLLQYQVGDERDVKLRSTINFAAGKLDLTEPGGLVQDSGFLPGRLGQLVNYTNINGVVALTHKVGRSFRLSSTETVGLIQYPAQPGLNYFGNMPGVSQTGSVGDQTQYRVSSRNEVEWIVDRNNSLFADGEMMDVSYQQTASYPGFLITAGYGRVTSTVSRLRMDAGIMKYWVNPAPGIIMRPKYLPTASITFDHTFTSLGLPHLSTHVTASIKPFFNLQFSNLEPRTTLQWQLTYAATKRLSLLGSARLLSSMVGSFTHWEKLPGGHPKNIFLINVGLHYTWRDILTFDCNAYGSDQLYVSSATSPYNELRQIYLMLGLRGTWQSHGRKAASHG